MITLEKDVETKLRRMVEKHGGRCLKWVCPGWTGVPDRIVLLPGGVVMFVETKRPKGGKFSAMQLKWREWLIALGFDWWHVAGDTAVHTLELVIVDKIGRRTR